MLRWAEPEGGVRSKALADWRNGKEFMGENRGGAGLSIKEAGRSRKDAGGAGLN